MSALQNLKDLIKSRQILNFSTAKVSELAKLLNITNKQVRTIIGNNFNQLQKLQKTVDKKEINSVKKSIERFEKKYNTTYEGNMTREAFKEFRADFKKQENKKKKEKNRINLLEDAIKQGFIPKRRNVSIKKINEFLTVKSKEQKRLQRELERFANIDIDIDEVDSYYFKNTKIHKLLNGQISNESYILNKPYRLTKNNIFLAKLIHRTINLKKNLYSQGVNIYTKLIFNAHKKTQDIDTTQTTPEKLPSNGFKEIVNHLIKLYEKFEANSDMVVDVISVKFLVMPLSKEGGCSERTHKETIQRSKKEKIKVINYFSRNNNCLFAVFHSHFNIKGNKLKPDVIRKELGLTMGTKVDYTKIPQILQYYNKMTEKDYGFLLINQNYEIIAMKDDTRLFNLKLSLNKKNLFDANNINQNDYVKIMINDGHYYGFEMTSYTYCDKCNDRILSENMDKHVCCNSSIARKEKIHKGEFVKNKDIQDKQELNYNKVLFFDFETYPDKNGVLKPYCVGFKHDNHYNYFWGEDCCDKLIDYICYQGTNVNHVVAYNGSKFDFYFIINRLLDKGININDRFILSSGRLLNFKFEINTTNEGKKHAVNVFDLCQFLMCSLKSACDSFNVPEELTKGDFDVLKIKNMFLANQHQTDILKYLKNDVLSMEDIFIKFNKFIYDVFKCNITKYITISSMAYSIWASKLEELIEIPKDKEKYEFISQSVYGGRCHPVVKKSVSKHYDDVIEGNMTYNELLQSKKFIFNADCTSLYPASMGGCELLQPQYPIGISRFTERCEEEFLSGKLGFYHIKFSPPKDITIAVLARRGPNGLLWSLEDGEGVYNNIDIQNAIDAGYKIEFLNKALVWDNSANIFDDYINTMYQLKETAERDGNDVKRSIAKLMMNALYGKTLQRPIMEKTQIINNIFKFNEFINKYDVTDWEIINENSIIVSGQEKDIEKVINKPFQLGSFVLSYSRKLMISFMKEIDPSLKSILFTYTDTDSLHISGEAYFNLKEKGLIKDKNNSKLGYLCSDIKKEGLIIKEINLGPKNYMYEYITNDNKIHRCEDATMKCKGINFDAVKFDKNDLRTQNGNENKKEKIAELYEKEQHQTMYYTSLKKVHKKISSQDRSNGVENFSIKDITCERTFNKNPFTNMIIKNNLFLPFDYNGNASFSIN